MLPLVLTVAQQTALERLTDRLVYDIYFELELAREHRDFVERLCDQMNPAEVDRAITLCLAAAPG